MYIQKSKLSVETGINRRYYLIDKEKRKLHEQMYTFNPEEVTLFLSGVFGFSWSAEGSTSGGGGVITAEKHLLWCIPFEIELWKLEHEMEKT